MLVGSEKTWVSQSGGWLLLNPWCIGVVVIGVYVIVAVVDDLVVILLVFSLLLYLLLV